MIVAARAMGCFTPRSLRAAAIWARPVRQRALLFYATRRRAASHLPRRCTPNSIDELRKLPAKVIASAQFDGLPDIPHSNAALPIMDGYVIPDDTYQLYATGKQAHVPLLIGYNRNEGAYIFRAIETSAYVAATRKTYGALADQFLALYPAAPETESARSQIRLAAESAFGWQTWAWARAHARTSQHKVFFYYFSDEQTAHGAELPYVLPVRVRWWLVRASARAGGNDFQVLDDLRQVRRPEWPGAAALAGIRSREGRSHVLG